MKASTSCSTFGPYSPIEKMRRWLPIAALCLLAFALSWAYLQFYLRGGPRIIDATSYFLEARSLAAGAFTFDVPDPSAAFRGRFLLASADGHRLGVLFPPGYPFVLSLGMRVGAPLLVGPTLGALLVAATYWLTRTLGEETKVATLAAALSALSAALRYHSADTMSHALSALLGCTALGLSLKAERPWAPTLTGLCLGLLVATRPVSAAVSWLLVGYVLRRRPRAWPLLLLGALPGVLLLLASQHALTGHWLSSTQLAYYAASDAPAGCFRYGFGAGIGCRYEHGDYVTRFIPDGFGARHALRSLVVHLKLFCTDATNAWPLSALGVCTFFKRRGSSLGLLGVGILLQGLAYAPFYFDGNYPGGGARFLCEALPFAHILVARGAFDFKVGWLAPALSVAGFVLYARHGHEELRDREGGRPLFEAGVVAQAGVTHGLLFVNSDHGFNLGFDPRVTDPHSSVLVARSHGDGHDRWLYEALGRPPTYRYIYEARGRAPSKVVRFEPPPHARLEAEAGWPALLDQGSAYPIHYPCASGSRALRLLPGSRIRVDIGPRREPLHLGWIGKTGAGAELRVRWAGSTTLQQLSIPGPGCRQVELLGPPPGGASPLLVELSSGEGALDYVAPALASPKAGGS